MADRWLSVMNFVQLARLFLMCIVWKSLSGTSRAYFESTSFHDLRPLELYNEAVKTQSKGEFANAIPLYLQALEMFPQFPEAHQNLGHLYDHQNDLIAARMHHEASVKYASSAKFNASAIVNLVLVERKLQPLLDKPQLLHLSALLDEAELLEPSNVNVIFTHALIYEQSGETQLCTAKLKRVIALDDRHSLAWLNLGNQWFRANDFDVAAKFYKNALERLPGWDVYNRVLVLNNLGQCYRERGHFRLAYEVFHGALLVIQATSIDTDSLTTVTDGTTRELDGGSGRRASKNGVDFSGGRYDGKAVHFWCINNLYTIQGMLCDWRGFESLEQHILEFIYAPEERVKNVNEESQASKHQLASFRAEGVHVDAYTMSLLRYATQRTDKFVCEQSCLVKPLYNHDGTHQEARDVHSSSRAEASGDGSSSPNANGRSLKVAYLSHDWRDHPMGRLTATLVTGHHQDHTTLSTFQPSKKPRVSSPGSPKLGTNPRINATSVSYGANDKSSIREYVESHSSSFVDILHVHNDIEAAAILHQRNFDIVVDITGHTYNGRIEIAALRPAPTVINYLGFPGTTGCAGFDYSMVHHAIVPPEITGKLFTERMLYLPYTYQSNDMLLRVAPAIQDGTNCPVRGKLVRSQGTRGEHTTSDVPVVPEDSLLVCSFNANKKMEPVSFHSWMNILLRVPTAVLVLLDVSAETKGHILAQLGFHGLGPHRAVFIPKRNWRRHLMRSAECDLVLDTLVYGAHTTASDVLWMGAPLLSLTAFGSQRMPSRVAASITQALSVPQSCIDSHSSPVEPAHILVVDSIREYEDTAVRYLRSVRSIRSALTRSILHRAVRSAAFDSDLVQKTVEFAYQLTYEVRAIIARVKDAALPHIFIPDVFSASVGDDSVNFNGFQCGMSWRKKFRRDLQKCCDLGDGDLSDVFAHLDQPPGAAESVRAAEVVCECRRRKNSVADADHACSAADLDSLLRRLSTAYPTLAKAFLDVTPSPQLEAAGSEEGTAEDIPALASDVASPLHQTFDCVADLTLDCTTQLFVHLQEGADCNKAKFLSTMRHCYQESAPTVMDFLLSVTSALQEKQQCQAVASFFEFTRPVMFTNEHRDDGDRERTSSADLLKTMSSVTTYLSPLWRNLSVPELRKLVVHHLLPPSLHLLKDRTGTAVTSAQYDEYLQHFAPNVLASALDAIVAGTAGERVTVCSTFLRAHGIVLPADVEVAHCLNFLTQQLATLFTTHSMCLSQLPADQRASGQRSSLSASQRAVLDMVAAFMLDPTDQRLLNLGTVLMDAHLSEVGFFLSSVAALRRLKATSVEEYPSTKPLIPAARASILPTDSTPGLVAASVKPKIIFYCDEYGQGWWTGWGPSSFHQQADGSPAKGMGGSEEAVYYTSVELARLGYDVVVYSSVTSADHGSVHYYTADGLLSGSGATAARAAQVSQQGVGSVTWLHHDTYNPVPDAIAHGQDRRCEIFIAWRYTISLGLARHPRHFAGCGRKYLWLHDLIPGNILPPSFFLHFDGILVQSEFHKDFIRAAFAPHAAAHAYVNMTQVVSGIAVIPNGISQMHPMDGANDNAVFIYGSAPGRGLEHVLSQWGTIKKSIPHATLEVYYGFTDTALKDLREKMGVGFERWYQQMQSYLLQDGIKYFGTVDHETLTAAFTRAGFLLYPTTFQETGCITVLRAMACGAIPITSRLVPSVLATLTAGHDLGPAQPLTMAMSKQSAVLAAWLQEQWTPAVIRAYNYHADELQTRRAAMKEMTRSTYSWTQTAAKLVNLFQEV